MEMVLLGSSGPRAAIGSHALNEAIFCSGEIDFPFRGRFVLPEDWCLLGYIHHTPAGSWCHGTSLGSGMAFTILPEGISEFMLCAGSQITVMLIPLEQLQRKLVELVPHQGEIPTRLLSLFNLSDEPSALKLHTQFERIRQHLIFDHLPAEVPPLLDEDANALLESHLLAGLSASAEDRPQCSRGRRTHYLIVQRTEQFMRANMRHDIYNNEMCNAAGVSERALRYAFEDLLGLSPNRYLSMLRLCTACRSLSMSDASRRSVKSVALSCGFWDLSRFADHYRRVFGELPRDTLMRAPPIDAMSVA
ncbi:AraC family transcriptional regulator [Dyella tabacisoli]|nr:helix-turn-helix domain-containing protein [Dyella tabacisoli]